MEISKEILEIVLKFIESPEMADHLRGDYLTINDIIEIIIYSRASLADKLPALQSVYFDFAKHNAAQAAAPIIDENSEWHREYDKQLEIALDKLIKMISFVLNEITENTPPNTVFLLHGYKYDEIDEASYDWHCVPYTNFEAARRGIIEQTRKYIADYGEDDDKTVCRWYCIGKWLPDGTGEMNNIVSWYMSNAGVVWFADINEDYSDELQQLTDDAYWNLCRTDHSIDGISIPFKEGDIVTIDNRPSLPICHAVISKILDRVYDCCGIQAIYINSDGELDQSALKHDLMGRGIGFPLFSCMYRLSKFTGELPEEETVLNMVSERLKQAPSLADDEGFLHHIAQQVNR